MKQINMDRIIVLTVTIIAFSLFGMLIYQMICPKKKEKVKDRFKDVRIMEGTWVVDGKRELVEFHGTYMMDNCGCEWSSTGREIMNKRLEYGMKRGFMHRHDLNGCTTDDLIAMNRISEISVLEDSLILPLEEFEG